MRWVPAGERGSIAPTGDLYPWDPASTYLRAPTFADPDAGPRLGLYTAWPLLVLGDDITTDHISPAGAIPPGGDAGRWLIERGEDPADLNVFSSRRGNWEVMLRGLFTNRSVRNLLAPGLRPGETLHISSGEAMPVWRAAERYARDGDRLVIVAGERYGMGSSRDWAAKGVWLLGVRAVLALGFERIHRSNLINMGVLPLILPRPIGLAAGDRIEIDAKQVDPHGDVPIAVIRATGEIEPLRAKAAIETGFEADMLRAGGILPAIVRSRLTASCQ
jgi:aconitate hydratase